MPKTPKIQRFKALFRNKKLAYNRKRDFEFFQNLVSCLWHITNFSEKVPY